MASEIFVNPTRHPRFNGGVSASEVRRPAHAAPERSFADRDAGAARFRTYARGRDVHVVEPSSIDTDGEFHGLVGTSSALQAVLRRVRMVAATEATVLVTGETGTGKELVARAVHHWSARAKRPFVSVNCAAIPHTLIASEWFATRGAFTGALQSRQAC